MDAAPKHCSTMLGTAASIAVDVKLKEVFSKSALEKLGASQEWLGRLAS